MLIAIAAILILLVLFCSKQGSDKSASNSQVHISYISADKAGTIEKFFVNEGDYVTKGEKLFLLKQPDGTNDEITSCIEGTILEIYLYEETRIKDTTIIMKIINAPEEKNNG